MTSRLPSLPTSAADARILPPDLQAKVDEMGDGQLLEDGQEEVFSRAEVEGGAIEHKVSDEPAKAGRPDEPVPGEPKESLETRFKAPYSGDAAPVKTAS